MRMLMLAVAAAGGLLSGCAVLPAAPPEQQAARLIPDAFRDGNAGAYVVVYKGDIGGLVTNRVRLDEGPYFLLGSNACVIWKVTPGVHTVEYDIWAGHDMTKLKVAENDRALLEVLGTTGIVGRSILVQGDTVSKLRLEAFSDLSR